MVMIAVGQLLESMRCLSKACGYYVKWKEARLASTMSASSQAMAVTGLPGCCRVAKPIHVLWATVGCTVARARIRHALQHR